MKKLSILIKLFFMGVFFASAASAAEQEATTGNTTQKLEVAKPIPGTFHELSNEWKHKVMIYGWLAIPDGTTTFNIPSRDPDEPDEEVESDLPENIDMFFMGTYRGEKGKFTLLFDAIYLGMSGDNGTDHLDLGVDTSMDAWMASLYGGYNIINNQHVRLDLITGVRYLTISYEADFSAGHIDLIDNAEFSPDIDMWDAVVGVDGSVYINRHWFVPYHFDIGAGSSDLTWRASAGLGYGFSWGDIVASYRKVYYDLGDSKFIQDVEFSGPLVGVSFYF